uniref:Uncharacterized protein n=1 Tax=Anopheles farauti TaxID=69004 RepID=A0A182QGS5_9DIPT
MFDRIDVPETIIALSSDHFPMIPQVDDEATHSWRQRRNYRKADWCRFESIMDSIVPTDVPLDTGSDIDAALANLDINMKEAESRSVPLVEVRSHLVSIDSETQRLISIKNSMHRRSCQHLD